MKTENKAVSGRKYGSKIWWQLVAENKANISVKQYSKMPKASTLLNITNI